MSTELQKLEIDEVSGVDAPAHGIGGWMVMKNGDVQASTEAQLAAVYATLAGADVIAAAPEDVRKAAQLVADFAERQLSAPEPEPSLIEKMKTLFKGKQPVPAQPDDDADDAEPQAAAKPKVKKDKGKAKVAQPNGTDDSQNTQEAQDVKKSAILSEVQELRKALTERDERHEADMEVLKNALVGTLERVEQLENELTGSAQISGQEYASVEKAAGSTSLQAGIMRAFAGDRVTLS